MSVDLYVVLLHHPVYDKNGQIVATAVTNMDVHDLARIGKTYGLSGIFIATPVRALRLLAEKIIEHWKSGFGAEYNETRREALALVRTVVDLDQAILEIERETGERPVLVATSAREASGRTSFAELRARLRAQRSPHLLILGTGWGLAREILDRSDLVLEAIRGVGDYNHLPVRAAAAILLDRLVGR
ncbi:MAG: RNA methyltransferase [Candidatus Binatia bacterium]